jgi:diguanylate cyclase (GGDEF)-like protein/PAS domain S-box-containing protein
MKIDYKALLTHVHDGVYFTDTERKITYWNQEATRITGYTAEEVVGNRCRDNILMHVDEDGQSLCKGRCPLAKAIESAAPGYGRVFLHHKDGHRVPVNVRVIPLLDTLGNVIGGAEFFKESLDEDALQQRIDELEQLALTDHLTQLPNRNHLQTTLMSRFHELSRLGIHFGLFFMDIDHFKKFNDTYGHEVGDQVLKTVANTLKSSLRPYDIVGRWGGEEFLGIIHSVDRSLLSIIANRQRRLISSSSVPFGQERLYVSVSMGATLATDQDSPDTLVKRADQLMYRSKEDGRDRLTMG